MTMPALFSARRGAIAESLISRSLAAPWADVPTVPANLAGSPYSSFTPYHLKILVAFTPNDTPEGVDLYRVRPYDYDGAAYESPVETAGELWGSLLRTLVPISHDGGFGYGFEVAAHNSYGWSDYNSYVSSEITQGIAKPEAPTDLVATGGSGTADVSWTPGSDNGTAITSYLVTAWADGPGQVASISSSGSPQTVSGGDWWYPFFPLDVFFRVSAFNANGYSLDSADSNTVTVT